MNTSDPGLRGTRNLPGFVIPVAVFWGIGAVSTLDFFCSRLDTIVDMRHPLVVLAGRLPWGRIEQALAPKNGYGVHSETAKPSACPSRGSPRCSPTLTARRSMRS